jgi:hypothetical protein
VGVVYCHPLHPVFDQRPVFWGPTHRRSTKVRLLRCEIVSAQSTQSNSPSKQAKRCIPAFPGFHHTIIRRNPTFLQFLCNRNRACMAIAQPEMPR